MELPDEMLEAGWVLAELAGPHESYTCAFCYKPLGNCVALSPPSPHGMLQAFHPHCAVEWWRSKHRNWAKEVAAANESQDKGR